MNTTFFELDCHIRNLPSIASFKRAILKFIHPSPSPTFKIINHQGLILLTRLRVGFSHLREHKFRHGFLDIVDPFCSCRTNAIETTEHLLLHCSNFSDHRTILFDDLRNIEVIIFPLSISTLCRMLLYGNPWRYKELLYTSMGNPALAHNVNREILHAVISFIISSNRFSGSLFE